MHVHLGARLREFGKLLAVALVAGAVGVGAGVGVAQLGGADKTTAEAPAVATSETSTSASATTDRGKTATTATTATTGGGASTTGSSKTTTSGAEGNDGGAQGSRPLRVQVVSAVLTPAGSESGRARRRARVTVRLRVANPSGQPSAPHDAALVVGDKEVPADPNAEEAAGGLLRPVPAKRRAIGELRFETAGKVTDTLMRTARAELRYGSLTRRLSIEIGPPAQPGG